MGTLSTGNISLGGKTSRLRFGKLAPKRSMKSVALSNFMTPVKVPFPQVHAWERPIDYGMLGNDTVGDCTIAGALHKIMNDRAVANAGLPSTFTTDQALSAYSAVTGYKEDDPSTDNGAALYDVLNYWQDAGFFGHKLAGRVTVDVQNIDMVKAAIFLFGGLYIGFVVPESVANDPLGTKHWRIVPGDKPTQEGHCVTQLGYGRAGLTNVSWGTLYTMTWDFWLQYADEAYALVTPDFIKQSGKSPTGFDLQGMLAELKVLVS
jgi:hypothetical protein